MHTIVRFDSPDALDPALTGGKGANLALLFQNRFPVPDGWILTTTAFERFNPKLPLPDDLTHAVEQELRAATPGQRFAVRSSSTLEDLAGSAFAGQHDTFLHCRAIDVLQAIRNCYLSLGSERAVHYREQRGFDHGAAKMAVVVQTMVPSTRSGVAFSINPVSGRLDEIVIDANYGLGESVVSGEVGVDHFEIDKSTLALRQASIGAKEIQIVGTDSGTCEREVDASARGVACLDASEIKQVAELVRGVDDHLGFPQDIEWAYAAGRLHLLQARPVTTIPARWTRDESAERFPTVMTPMTWDLVEKGFHESLEFSFGLMGFPPFHDKWFSAHDHYIYGNQNAIELYLMRPPFRAESFGELEGIAPTLAQRFRWVQELPVRWTRDLDDFLIRIGEFKTLPLDSLTLPEVWDHVREVSAMGAEYFRPNIAISITQGTLYRLLHDLVPLAVGPDRAASLVGRLTAFCETKTGMVNKELFELAQRIRESPGLDSIDVESIARYPEVAKAFGRFLKSHGHREVEFDAYHPTWIDAPELVCENLRLILQSPMDVTPGEKERALKVDMQRAEAELMAALPESLRFLFGELIRLTRLYTSLDDLEHYETTRLTPVLRRALRELGSRLVKRGILADPMDVFFSHVAAMDRAVAADSAEEWQRLAAAVLNEKEAYENHRGQTPPWNLQEDEGAGGESAHDAALRGIAGSSGIAIGSVWQVRTAADMAVFPKGAILVARTTSPAWTPLFYSAKAVITESGGPLSHGAVTAREMGIPAVMAIRDACARLPDGTRVRVDGGRGTVEILEPAAGTPGSSDLAPLRMPAVA